MWCYISRKIGATMKDLIILIVIIVVSVVVVRALDALAIAARKYKK